MMAQVSKEPVNTCSIAFGEAEYNEADYAAAVAQKFGCRHQVGAVDPNDHSLLDSLAGLYDEPFADSSAMPTYRVCELAKKKVTVVLSGDGGDENLAGYRRYGQHLDDLAGKARMPSALRRLLGVVGAVYPDSRLLPPALRRRQGLISMGQDPVESQCGNQTRSAMVTVQPGLQKPPAGLRGCRGISHSCRVGADRRPAVTGAVPGSQDLSPG
jgi:asparagine synthase (glutamine-hydrolysing)